MAHVLGATNVNASFVHELDTADGQTKIAQLGTELVQDKQREDAFWRQIIPPRQVTRAECTRAIGHDTLVRIIDIAPSAKALPIDFRSQTRANYIQGDRYPVAFFTIMSEIQEKTTQELAAYETEITEFIEEDCAKAVTEIEDLTGVTWTEASVQYVQYEANGYAYVALHGSTIGAVVEEGVIKSSLARADDSDDFDLHPLQRADFLALSRLFYGRNGTRLNINRVLMTNYDYDGGGLWTAAEVGDEVANKSTTTGFAYKTIFGRQVVTTIKTDILRPGNVYAFAPAGRQNNYVGHFFILNPLQFWVEKKINKISFCCYEDIGMGIANVRAVRKLELYSGSATPTATDTGVADVQPMEPEALGSHNHRVDEGIWFPPIEW